MASALLAARMIAWTLFFLACKHWFPLARLARIAWSPPRAQTRVRETEAMVLRFARGIFRRVERRGRGRCLERSLVLYRFLSMGNAAPVLVIGMAKKDRRLVGHAWVRVDGESFGDAPEVVEEYTPLLFFGRRGERLTNETA